MKEQSWAYGSENAAYIIETENVVTYSQCTENPESELFSNPNFKFLGWDYYVQTYDDNSVRGADESSELRAFFNKVK